MLKESLFNRIGIQFFAESGAEGGAEGGEGSQENGGSGGTPPKTFTQEEVGRMMASEKRSGRMALLKELGYEVKEGEKFQDIVAKVKGILDQGKTQQQLDQEAKTKAETDLANERTRNNSLQAQIEVMKAGVKPEYVDDVISMLMPKITEDKPLSKLLEEYKTKYPLWFGESGGSGGTGGSTNPPRGKGGTNTEGLGKRLAQANKTTTKSSFFKN